MLAATAIGSTQPAAAQGMRPIVEWRSEADVVVIGAGAMGLPAAIVAREAGASVIVVEAEPDIGGHAITSGGNVPLGGGTSAQQQHGIEDLPDLLFRDLTDWSVVEPNGFPDYRYNDHEIIRAFADNCVATYDWLVAHGVIFVDQAPDARGGNAVGNSVPREMHCCRHGLADGANRQAGRSRGAGDDVLGQRPDAAAGSRGAAAPACEILLRHRMVALASRGAERRPRARRRGANTTAQHSTSARGKAVIIATGGSTGNVNFRRMFDPRLTEEYCGLAGMPWSDQDASGEIAAMAIGASLWGLYNQAGEFGYSVTKPAAIGCQYGYQNLRWMPGSAVFDRARAIGLRVARLAGRDHGEHARTAVL